ncbi:electron transfer flavoprotein subunit beta/FixA family protein [Glycomyces algeriensis]|uniref:Electron transfer flavoprotein subunit beta n=1 Tax=Glycomyces algeriensis TaxID=256037 RepID=A0A9W6GCS3_9ACTN|nr:electron transfer flavoprotein subunit beta/FixA family protein [Glycomyces algeriensis]MDA1368688.1 electron transfer flavoprotein subunit beta/FixA family protein [Glycomyces algeriensis]MDR7351726.1 electron transfer flavoprotein beta subunit [Glycomyces algeriensis]GLI44452.1 electron transfer flavoprotein subunit beta [Glycomyces algeriensis]
MNIVVLVKQVPDSGLARQLDAQLRVDRNGANNVMGELDEYAVEAALQLKEAHGGEVTVLTLGPGQATETVRKVLAMGADKAVHIEDDAVGGSDALTTSAILAAALGRLEWDLVVAGAESTDSGMGVMPQLLAARTGAPALTGARKIDIAERTVTVEHQRANGYDVLSANLPAIVSVWDTINTPRYPSLKGIMAAKRKPVETLALADLGVSEAGPAAARNEVLSAAERPPRAAGQIVADEGQGGDALADFLAAEKFI